MSESGAPPERFAKPALSVDDLLHLLKERGLIVPDDARAKHYLTFIGYYRLSGYFRFFQLEDDEPTAQDEEPVLPHQFREKVEFEDVLDLYIFDRELRLLVMDAIERIEVAFRSVLSDAMCTTYREPHWYLERTHFRTEFDHDAFLDDVSEKVRQDSNPPFIQHYLDKYDEPGLPPSWMIIEIMPLGTWSKAYSGLARHSDLKLIAGKFGVPPQIFRSWIQCVSVIRNLCAHHMRLWNKRFIIKPKSVFVGGFELKDNPTFYAQAAVIQRLLQVVAPGSIWGRRILDLLLAHPHVNKREMGFPEGWERNAFWGTATR
ncbi:MAG TPA: Abi family protein [Clostridia bacterium]|nr:Abi family protein [Clostridia bacterium]